MVIVVVSDILLWRANPTEVEERRCERISCHTERIDTDELRISASSSEEIHSTERRPIGKHSQDTVLAKHLAPLKKSGKKRSVVGYFSEV